MLKQAHPTARPEAVVAGEQIAPDPNSPRRRSAVRHETRCRRSLSMKEMVDWLAAAAKEASYRVTRLLPESGRVQLEEDVPTWFFGQQITLSDKESSPEQLLSQACCCLCFTYRHGFAAVPGTSLTSDAGWGCMMRTGQMILAKALLLALTQQTGRTVGDAPNGHRTEALNAEGVKAAHAPEGCDVPASAAAKNQSAEEFDFPLEASIVRLFADCVEAPFSIQRITLEGAAQGTPIGRWLGPASIAQVLSQLVARALASSGEEELRPSAEQTAQGDDAEEHLETADANASASSGRTRMLPPKIRLHVAMDGIIFRSEARAAANGVEGCWQPLMLLVPLRLGLDQINLAYAPCLRALLELPQSIGIIGGRPRKSYYFVGYQAHNLLYLDPHQVHPALSYVDPDLSTCDVAGGVRSIPVAEIDPSMAVGFFCPSADSFEDLCNRCLAIETTTLAAFSVADSPPDYLQLSESTHGLSHDDAEEDPDLVVVGPNV